jgi:intracellular sulfur oxidation DsrE/DsrF family protein
MRIQVLLLVLAMASPVFATDPTVNPPTRSGAQTTFPPYTEQKVVFDFYFDHPQKIGPAIQWVDGLMKPLISEPYSYLPEFLDIKVILHGTEVVALARKNYKTYQAAVERMRFLASLGVEFRVCATSLQEYAYRPEDMQEFLKIVPSAITDLAHWQLKGYAVIQPQILSKKFASEDIR